MQAQKLISADEHAFLRQVEDAYRQMVDGVRDKRTGWACVTADEKEDFDAELKKRFGRGATTNDERSLIEVYEWHQKIPEMYFAYWQDDCRYGAPITNFMGAVIGKVVSRGQPYRMGHHSKKVRVLILGTNGATYKGTAELDNGNYVTMRIVKGDLGLAGTPSPFFRKQMQEAS